MYKWIHCSILVTVSAFVLSGCVQVPFILAATGIGVGSAIAVDRRSAEAQLDDKVIDAKGTTIARETYSSPKVTITSFNRVTLLTGEVQNTEIRSRIEKDIRALPNVRGVFNDMTIETAKSNTERGQWVANDSWITSKIKAAFATDKDINGRDIKVVTEAGVVYLMGILTQDESLRARDHVAKSVSGIRKVVSLFEIASPQALK